MHVGMAGKFLSRCRPWLALTALILVFATGAFAQRDLGTITGTVTDPQGAVVPNVKITITEVATGQVYRVETGADGSYTRPALKPGTYTVDAEAQGFRRVQQQNIIVTAGDRVGVNLVLAVGAISESIEVTSEAPLLQTESTTLGADLNTKSMSDLPLGGQRTFSFLARLSPGVLTAEQGARDAVGGGFSANGVRSNGQNNFLLNGVDNNVNVIDFLNQTAYVVGPSVEAIGEMRVLTNGYNAEYGRGAGGVVNVSLKSGTNQLHGVLFEILQNADLDANRWEYNAAGTKNGVAVAPRGQFEQNQFGAAAGGPIIKNRTFIFGDYQGTRIVAAGGVIQNLGNSGSYTIPTALMKQGNFSELPQGIYDPTTHQAFSGKVIPQSKWDPVAQKIIALYPATNQPIDTTSGYPFHDYFVSTPGNWVTDQGDLRIDHRLSDKDSLFGTMSWSNTNKTNTAPFPGALDGATFAGVPEQDLSRNGMASWTRVWTPSILTETRLAFTRLVTSRVQTANASTDEYKAFGIGGFNPMTTLNGGLPQITFGTQFQTQYPGSTYSQIGANDWLPSKEYSNVWDFIQNVAVTKGGHAMKFGLEIRQIRFPFFQVPYPHGEWYFTQNETSNATLLDGPQNGTSGGDQIASFLLGAMDWGQISTNNFISSQKWAYAGYAQDDWKITPKLTLSLGLRYELFSPINEGFGRQSNLDYANMTLVIPKGPNQTTPLPPNFATAFPEVKVSVGQQSSYLIPWDKWDVGPRFGLAYNWHEKTVIRLGYGIFYGGEEQQGGNPNRGESVPFNESPILKRDPSANVFSANPYFTGGLSAGFPGNVFTLPVPISFRSLATDFRNTLVHKWNVAIQRELPGQMAVELAYVGNHTAHALLQPDWNAAANLSCAAAGLPAKCSINGDALRPHPDLGSLFGTGSLAFGNYAGMTATLTKRYSSGLQFLAAYTYGHALSSSATTLSGSSGLGSYDNADLSKQYSTASWDIRHNFTTSFSYDLPFGKGKKYGASMNRAADIVVGNWQMNGILTVHTGQPFTINGAGCYGYWAKCRPDLVAGKNPNDAPSGGRTPSDWFDWTAVTFAAANTGGNLGLQSNIGPPLRSLDFSVFKDFAFTERWRLQFRAEAFNLSNTPQYDVSTINNNLGAVATNAAGQIVGQGSFGTVGGTLPGTERHVQFSLRLMF